MSLLDEITDRIRGMSPADRAEIEATVQAATQGQRWTPNPGPQTEALHCAADELFYGGQAGGGKTDLLVGLTLTQHRRSLVLRRTNKEATKLVERFVEVIGSRKGWNGQDNVWRLDDGRIIDISGVQHEDDKQKFKGTPHDLIAFDEVADFSETQFRFLIGWNRSVDEGQRCRVVATGNPPTTPEGLWVMRYWAPWLDPTHPRPAKAGELRWFTTIAGEDSEVDGPGPHLIDGEMILAKSRTFIPAALSDNPDLSRTGYSRVVAALPEPYRSAYKDGRFDVALQDDERQVIPTAWIFEAQQRWKPGPPEAVGMTVIGVDVSGGGADRTILAPRYLGWFAPLEVVKDVTSSEGTAVAAAIFKTRRNNAPVVIDMGGGFGGAPALLMRENAVPVRRFNGAERSTAKAQDGSGLSFINRRAEVWWRFREALDPSQEGGSIVQLPDDPELRADLTAPHFEITSRGVQIESKDDIRKRIGRSPDRGDAVVMAWAEGEKALANSMAKFSRGHEPSVVLGYGHMKRRRR